MLWLAVPGAVAHGSPQMFFPAKARCVQYSRKTGKDVVSAPTETPFDSIEGSHRYLALLVEAIEEAQADIEAEIGIAVAERAARRKEALQIVAFKLNKLVSHMTASRRILNDLRTLQRLLLEEKAPADALVRTAGD